MNSRSNLAHKREFIHETDGAVPSYIADAKRAMFEAAPFSKVAGLGENVIPLNRGMRRMLGKIGSDDAQKALQANIARRNALLGMSPRFTKDLGTQSASLGGNIRIKLYNVGLLTGVWLRFTMTYTIGTATASISSQGPFNLATRIRLTDYDGTDRVNVTGDELFVMNCIRSQEYWGYANGVNGSAGIAIPNVPTAVGAASLEFWLYVPVAFDPERDLRGAMVMQTSAGEVYLSIDLASLLYTNADARFVYNGGATTTVTGASAVTVQAWQDYLVPQTMAQGQPAILPELDVMTVYELAGTVLSSDNLAAGAEKLINFPNQRSVIGMYLRYLNGGVMNPGTDVTKLRIIANGNNILRDVTPGCQLMTIRTWCNSMDIRAGYYPLLFRGKPVETALFGNVQVGFTPTTVGALASTWVGTATESFFGKGMTLPGFSQASG